MSRTAPDPLTIAYIAIGARDALDNLKGRDHDRVTGASEGTGGEMNVTEEVIEHALELDIAADAAAERGELVGCFLYEVAEPFGKAYVEALARDEKPDAAQLMARLTAECTA